MLATQNLASAPERAPDESRRGADEKDTETHEDGGHDEENARKSVEEAEATVVERGQRQEEQQQGGVEEAEDAVVLAEEGGAEEEAESEVDIPDELEDIVEALLCGLRDRDTVVRWSAAKGIGRITERLPRELGTPGRGNIVVGRAVQEPVTLSLSFLHQMRMLVFFEWV